MATPPLFSRPETFRKIDPQHLRSWLAPYGSYLAGRGFMLPEPEAQGPINFPALAEVFIRPDTSMPKELCHSAALIQEMANDDAMMVLLDGAQARQIELGLGPDPDAADVAARMWIVCPEALEELHHQHRMETPRSFVHFATDRNPVPAFREPADSRIAELEAALGEWYWQKKKGRDVRVWVYPRGDEFWFLLRHGTPTRHLEVQGRDDAETLICRPYEYDVLVYHAERGEIRIHGCSKTEEEHLKEAFGEHLFGGADYFPGGAKFTLAPIVDLKRGCLACADIPGIERIVLVELQMFEGGNDWLRTTWNAPDLFTKVERERLTLPPAGMLVRANFKIRFSDSRKDRIVKLIGSNKLSVVRDGDAVLVERWLTARGFTIQTVTTENADEHQPLAVG